MQWKQITCRVCPSGIRKMRNSYLAMFLLINGVWLVFFSVFYLLFFEPEFTWAIDDIANVIFVVAIYGELIRNMCTLPDCLSFVSLSDRVSCINSISLCPWLSIFLSRSLVFLSFLHVSSHLWLIIRLHDCMITDSKEVLLWPYVCYVHNF